MIMVKSYSISNEKSFVSLPLVLDENGQPIFPTDDLAKLEEQVNRIRWTIPVLSDGELIKCLRAAVRLARKSPVHKKNKHSQND